MRAIADTAGMSALQCCAFWLDRLVTMHHRGPRRDTWTSARDRVAEMIGLERSMARRIWQRSDTMKRVDGDAVLKLMIAYEAAHAAEEAAKHDDTQSRAISELLAKALPGPFSAVGRKVGDRQGARTQ